MKLGCAYSTSDRAWYLAMAAPTLTLELSRISWSCGRNRYDFITRPPTEAFAWAMADADADEANRTRTWPGTVHCSFTGTAGPTGAAIDAGAAPMVASASTPTTDPIPSHVRPRPDRPDPPAMTLVDLTAPPPRPRRRSCERERLPLPGRNCPSDRGILRRRPGPSRDRRRRRRASGHTVAAALGPRRRRSPGAPW